MCIRDSVTVVPIPRSGTDDRLAVGRLSDALSAVEVTLLRSCLLYTSDAADERSSVDLGGRRIIKKKNNIDNRRTQHRYIHIDNTSAVE